MACQELLKLLKNNDYIDDINQMIQSRASDPRVFKLAHLLFQNDISISKDSIKLLYDEYMKRITVDEFFNGIGEMLSSEHSIYENAWGLFFDGIGVDYYILESPEYLLKKENPQVVFEKFIDTILKNPGYFHDFEKVIVKFLKKLHGGGRANYRFDLVSKLLGRNYENDVDFQDETYNYEVKKLLLKDAYMANHTMLKFITSYTDWRDIPYTGYWEDVIHKDGLTESEQYEFQRLQLLKPRVFWNSFDEKRSKDEDYDGDGWLPFGRWETKKMWDNSLKKAEEKGKILNVDNGKYVEKADTGQLVCYYESICGKQYINDKPNQVLRYAVVIVASKNKKKLQN